MPTTTDRRISPAMSFTAVNLSDTSEVRLIDLSALSIDDGMLNTNERGLYYCRGFHCNTDGTLVIESVGNISGHTVSLSVKDGMYYPYGVKKFMQTGSTGISNGQIIAVR